MSKALSKARVNIIAVTLMLIAFVGQVFAYADVSCQMTHDSVQSPTFMSHEHMSHAGMDHAGVDHVDMAHSANHADMNHASMTNSQIMTISTMDENCCGADCVCPASACTTVAFIPTASISTHIPYLSEAANFQQAHQLHSIASTLYRPPIIH